MTNRLLAALTTFAMTAPVCCADAPLLGDAARKSSPALFADDHCRQQSLAALDDYVAVDPDEAGWVGLTSKELGRAFRRPESGMMTRIDPHSVIPNPEPSSLAIWTALGCGLLAAAHGLRQRKSPKLAG